MEQRVTSVDDIYFELDKYMIINKIVKIDLPGIASDNDLMEILLLLDFYNLDFTFANSDRYKIIRRVKNNMIITNPSLVYCKIPDNITIFIYAKTIFFNKIYGRIVGNDQFLIRRRRWVK